MSDCYLGLDQQYDIYLHVTEANHTTQVNAEVTDALIEWSTLTQWINLKEAFNKYDPLAV